LKLFTDEKVVKEDDAIVGLAGGCCFDFNRQKEDLFVWPDHGQTKWHPVAC